ncbi:MAG: CHC2 zinc finger domain-containing protein, partial [Caldilinea sp.]
MVGNVTDEVKQRVDIVELIARYTPLKRAGSVYKGLCPFHSERTPSFIVFPHTGTWHCFGACGTGGDAFAFVMRKENLNFREALESLASQVGVVMPTEG